MPIPTQTPPESQGKPETGTKRFLPQRPKESNCSHLHLFTRAGLPDEWGAVVQLQAEAERQIKEEEKRLYKERQKRYKEDLDRQYLEVSKLQTAKRRDRDGMATLPGMDSERRVQEAIDRKKATTEELMREMQEREQTRRSERDRELAEKADYERYLRTVESSEQQRAIQDRQRKDQIANSLRYSHHQQQQYKRDLQAIEREKDKKLIEVEQVSWPVVDTEKKKMRDHLDRISKADQAKRSSYQSLVQESELQTRRKEFEAQSKMTVDKQQRDLEKELGEKDRRMQEAEVAKKILNQQLQEKAELNKQKRRAEDEFVQGVRQKAWSSLTL
jgi:hypothetical protein